jgi:hypothetical protein
VISIFDSVFVGPPSGVVGNERTIIHNNRELTWWFFIAIQSLIVCHE